MRGDAWSLDYGSYSELRPDLTSCYRESPTPKDHPNPPPGLQELQQAVSELADALRNLGVAMKHIGLLQQVLPVTPVAYR